MTTCNDNNNIKICSRFFHGEAMAQWDNRALIDPRVAGSNPAGQLLIYFHNAFPVLKKTLCRHSSVVPRSRIKAFVRKLRRCSPRPSAPLIGLREAQALNEKLHWVSHWVVGGKCQ